jgi:N-acetylglucosaminyldiphosphoundecaprenol N-acetyl-beta-D-mannosaminyltransferase
LEKKVDQANYPNSFVGFPVLGLSVAAVDYSEAVRIISQWVADRAAPKLVAAANTHLVTTFRRRGDFADALRRFDLVVPDGMPLVWYLNCLYRAGLKDRVYGPNLMLGCLAATTEEHRHFLLGGSEEILARLKSVLISKFPAVRIAGCYSPPFGDWPATEDDRIVQLIAQSGAQFVWVGLGCPKQELLLGRLKDKLPLAVYLAVGAAFPLLAGTVRQAPASWQRLGLEWAFRLLMEPRRLWRRYLVNNTLFLFYTALEIFRRKR